ncbi:MAG: Hsp20/alpha crystallin family protein [Gemmatimonadales bacterium]
MNIVKTTPTFAPARRDVDHFFERFFGSPMWPLATPRAASEGFWEPSLDVSENPKEYVVRLEAPGMNRDDLDVNLDGNLLTLSGKRELHRKEKGEDFLWEEREEGRFMRTLRLPTAVHDAKIEATYAEGILTVKLPKAEPAGKSKVTIK